MCTCIPLMCFAFDAGHELEIVEVHLNRETIDLALSNEAELSSQLAASLRDLIQNRIAEGLPPVGFCILSDSTDYPEEHDCEVCNPASASSGDAELGGKGSTSIEEIAKHFDKPIRAASKELKICTTILKRICRNAGIPRWPYRKIKKADRKITDTQMAAQEALATPGFQQLASHLVESCHELNRRRKECLGSLAEPSEDSPMTGKEGYEHEAEAS